MSRRQFLKGALAGVFGAGLAWAGAVRAEEEPEEGPCIQGLNEPDPAEQAAYDPLQSQDPFGAVPIIEGFTIPRHVLHEARREFESLDQIISTGYVDIQTDEPCPACEQVKLSMGYTVSVHNLNDPGCRMASWGYEFGEDAKSEGLRFKQGVLANGSPEWSIEPARRGRDVPFGDQTRLYVVSPDKPGQFEHVGDVSEIKSPTSKEQWVHPRMEELSADDMDWQGRKSDTLRYADDVYEFRLDEDFGSNANIEDLPDADFTLEPTISGCKNWRMVHGVPVCEDDAIGIRVDGKDVISSAIPVHEIGSFQHEGPRWKVEGVAWRFDENRAKVPISINEVHRFKALDGVEPTWAWGLDEAPVVTPETIEAMAGKDTILCFDGCPKNAEWFKYEQSIDGWVLTVRMSHFLPLGSSVHVSYDAPKSEMCLFSEKGFVRSFVRDLRRNGSDRSGPIAMYTYEIVEPFVFFEALDDTFQVWAKYLHAPKKAEKDVLDQIKAIANLWGWERWLCPTYDRTFARVQGNRVQVGNVEGVTWIVRASADYAFLNPIRLSSVRKY